jgi:photosystem II stability/assembly factor-like uncharacterized protein
MSERFPRTRPTAWAVLALVLAASSTFTADRATPAAARPVAAATASSHTLLALACPTVTVCYAGGNDSTMLGTKNAGKTWQPLSIPTIDLVTFSSMPLVHQILTALSCPSARTCFAPTEADCDSGEILPLLHTANGGTIWQEAPLPESCGVWTLACLGVTTCYTYNQAYVRQIYRTTTAGKRWQRLALPSYPGYLQLTGITCATVNHCSVISPHKVLTTTEAGRHWTTRLMNTTGPGMTGITCPTPRTCYAEGNYTSQRRAGPGVLVTTDHFRSWTTHVIPAIPGILGLTCPAAATCYGLAAPDTPLTGGTIDLGTTGEFVKTADGGKTWRLARIAPYPFYALACPSTTVCYAVGFLGRIVGTTNAGATWHDLLPAIFVSGTYALSQPLRTRSPWFTATKPWPVAVGTAGNHCSSRSKVTLYVRNVRNHLVAGPIDLARRMTAEGSLQEARSTIHVTGQLRLDVVSSCSTFSVRIDGVHRASR